ncbi:MAG: AAA family ATPase [Candidatus Pacebacteria bacterium]|nr:AAA family ATPase [Candidatus Paceibacterota bacterium]MDD4664712.1 AAA family ATPase [Candidatus Paceibacterota bacterium]
MNGANFTNKAQKLILASQSLAKDLGHQQVDGVHLLFIILMDYDNIVLNILKKLSVDLRELKKRTQGAINDLPKVKVQGGLGQFYLTKDLENILEVARGIAEQMEDEFISLEHLFLAMLSTKSKTKFLLERVKYNKNVMPKDIIPLNYDSVEEALTHFRGNEPITTPNPESKQNVIEQYSVNLTEKARKGELDPVIGREDETRRLMQILSRRTKNNPVLIGEPGVGKTAIVEGLAQKIVKSEVPESLKSKQVLALDLGAMIAGTRYRGEFEDRTKALLREVKRAKGRYLLFIDELHTLIGAGSAEGAMDASNLLKPALARGDLRAIGATTLKEYQKYIERDPALERRFQPILVAEPTLEDTVSILRGIKEKYEFHHGIRIKDSALTSAAELSQRYISDRYLPDKAVDLMDEAASAVRLEIESNPRELEELKKEIQKLEIEKEALKKEIPTNKKEETELKKRKRTIVRQLAELTEKASNYSLRWKNEKDTMLDMQELKSEIEAKKQELEQHLKASDLQKVAEIKYGTLPELFVKMSKKEAKLKKLQESNPILKQEIGKEDIAQVVARWTGIPVMRLLEEEAFKLEKMEHILSKRIISQKQAIESVSNAIRRSRAGISDESKPLGSFIFLGPTGVGKTETARALADFLFNDQSALIQVDMSEYMEKHDVSKMIGSPPGYVGYDEAGQLTEKIRRKPYAVVLLDEIEKAHPEIFNILLQVLEDGRLTDAKGRIVSFKNTILIMTSNVGSDIITNDSPLGFSKESKIKSKKELKNKVMGALKEQFKPEFLNRVDEIVIFDYLSKSEIKQIVDLELQKVEQRLIKKGIKIEVSLKAKNILADKGYDVSLGARPLKRVVQQQILNPLALKIVIGEIKEGDRIVIDGKNNEITFKEFTKKKLVKIK